ncbi:MAG: CDP-alcohol phosphatidyltransferase family protein [Oscillospiraceae bacterium]|nr:CDP-alcohol phosphatidyltransferase family protein [Oscillospiraceae bacterium]
MPLKVKKEDLWTIPNLLSFFRLVLIPVIIWLYISIESYYGAVAVIALSGLTDFLDGKIARKYNMITDLGKILDPVADKLTQAAMIICLISRYPLMWLLIALFVLKELVSASLGYLSLQASGEVAGAQWYGKINTALLYAVMLALILFPELPTQWVNALIGLTAVSLCLTFVLYIHFFWDLVKKGWEQLQKNLTKGAVAKIIGACLWLLVILFLLVYRENITMEAIVSFVPKNSWVSVLVMLLLFALKSATVVVYAGLLYAANGVLFSTPIALVMSVAGSFIMFTLPYCVARLGASHDVKKLADKYPNIKFLQGFPSTNKFLMNFVARIIGILPLDVVSAYMGTVRAKYRDYILGSLAGMAVSIVTFTVMGLSVSDTGSPNFYIALAIEITVNLGSLLAFVVYRKKKQKEKEAS